VAKEKEEVLRQMGKLNWEEYQQFLVKPYNQWMTISTSVE